MWLWLSSLAVCVFFIFFETIDLIPKKGPNQACWYCRRGHEHYTWLGAKICSVFFR